MVPVGTTDRSSLITVLVDVGTDKQLQADESTLPPEYAVSADGVFNAAAAAARFPLPTRGALHCAKAVVVVIVVVPEDTVLVTVFVWVIVSVDVVDAVTVTVAAAKAVVLTVRNVEVVLLYEVDVDVVVLIGIWRYFEQNAVAAFCWLSLVTMFLTAGHSGFAARFASSSMRGVAAAMGNIVRTSLSSILTDDGDALRR